MKNLLLLLVAGLAACGGYSAWNSYREASKPAPKVADIKAEEPAPVPKKELTPIPAPEPPKIEPGPPMPVAPARRLAPEGVFYVMQAFSVTTDAGVRGILMGTKVTLVKDGGATLRVSDGQQEFDARREFLTNDLDVAQQAFAGQAGQQAALAEWHAKQNQIATTQHQERNVDVGSSMEAAQRRLTLQNLLSRQSALNLEAAKIQASITTYERAPNRTGQIYHDQYGVRRVIVGDTHVNDLISLRQRLAVINSELQGISSKITEAQR